MQKFKRHSVAQQRIRIRQYYWLKENKSLKTNAGTSNEKQTN